MLANSADKADKGGGKRWEGRKRQPKKEEIKFGENW